MGGSSERRAAEDANNAVRQANIQQERENIATQKANWAREDEYYSQASAAEARSAGLLNSLTHQQHAMEAGNAAAMKVTQERADAIRKGGQIMTDFERQEKMRFHEAKKGVGQVDESDFTISQKDRLWAEDMLGKEPEYWDARRKEAYDNAAGSACGVGGTCSGACGGGCSGTGSGPISLEWARKKSERIPLQSEEAGKAYKAKETQTATQRISSGGRTRPSLLGTSPESQYGEDTGMPGLGY